MNEYGTSPIFFVDEEKRKEWENLDPQVNTPSAKAEGFSQEQLSQLRGADY